MESTPEPMEFGPQPIDRILADAGIANHVLVELSGEHLTHKEVAKARKGRRLTPNMIGKITRAMNKAVPREAAWEPWELFSYAGKLRRAWAAGGEGHEI